MAGDDDDEGGDEDGPHRVVVLGGGIAGIVVATHLARRLRRGASVEITLVDRNPGHVWKPMLHRFAAGLASYASENIAFASHARRNGFQFRPGALDRLDRGGRALHLLPLPLPDGQSELPARAIGYDTLVIAIGSQANDFGTPGVAEHCAFIDDIGGAERFFDLLLSRCLTAMAAGRAVTVAIVGGGSTGVELSAVLREYLDALAGYVPQGRRFGSHIVLVECGTRLAPPFPPSVSEDIRSTLERRRVTVRTETEVVGVDDGGLSLGDGGRIEAELVVWAAGVKASDVTERLDGVAIGRKKQIKVRPTLQSETDPDVFALGDCSELPGRDGKPLPTTGQVARQQAVFLARALARRLRSGRALPAFRYRDRGSLITLGDTAAYGTLGQSGMLHGASLPGRAAQVAHALLYRQHQLDLNGWVSGGTGWAADLLMRAAKPKIRLS